MNDPYYETLKHPIVTAEDIRQFTYCPRIIYFRYVARIKPKRTYKMQKGQERHEQTVRVKDVEISDETSKYYNYYLQDTDLGLAAVLDYFESDGVEATPVDIKTGHHAEAQISEHHLAQLIAQAFLLETQLNLLVRKVKVVYTEDNVALTHEFGIDERQRLLKNLKLIQRIITEEILPDPTPHRGKCADCEFWVHCLGV